VSAAAFRERLVRRLSAAGLTLDAAQFQRIEGYYRLLERWNQKINLTALDLHDLPETTLDRLIIEPIAAARTIEDERLAWLDVGSGGGSPAIPLKVVRPLLRLTMVESRSRKAAFLREVVRTLDLADTTVATTRVEDLAASASFPFFDLATVRAVRLNRRMAEALGLLLRPGGRLLVFGSADSVALGALGLHQQADLPGFPLVGGTVRAMVETYVKDVTA